MKKILIVEDSLPIITLHRSIARKAGLEPVVAKTLAEVKELTDRFDEFYCAIIDYSLPDAPEGEAIKYIVDRKVPSIVMTGMLDDKVRNHILRLPIIDYITKESKQAFHYVLTLLKRLQRNSKVKILVVDDSSSSRAYLTHLLARHNFTVLQAKCGVDALEVLEENPDVKLIITDKEMPRMDGIQLCNAVRAKYTKDDVGIIGISGADSQALTAKFIKNGANDFLQKPFCLEEFYCRVLQNVDYLQSIEIIRKQANTDYLTNLANRRYFFETVNPQMKGGGPHTLAMMDIDNFKSINDTYGHDAGDVVLKAIAKLLRDHFEQDFLVSRLGGEEFGVFFNQYDFMASVRSLDGFREELADLPIEVGKDNGEKETLYCTVSIGVSSEADISLDNLMIAADERLYKAKSSGKNKVIFE